MTNHWVDMKNADVILNCGSNSVENHPVSSRWVNRAVENGATWIVVDPRYTRTAANADLYCPIRSGTDIAFYGGMINYIIENDLWQHDYVLDYTNASYLINPDFNFDASTGLFSGWDEKTKSYDKTTWGYQTDTETKWDTSATGAYAWVEGEGVPEFTPPVLKTPKKDRTLKDPNCVFNLIKEHYSRYTLDTVSQICGMDKDVLEEVYKTYGATGAPEKSGTILYALGQTQHTYGTNNTRIMCMIQLLLGNIGMPGGGVNALRGEPNVQGCTDMCLMPGDLPGYLHWPTSTETSTLRAWCEHETYSDGYYTNKPKFMVSFLKSFFGKNATYDNDYGYDWLPKPDIPGNYTTIKTFHMMRDGIMKGYFALGMSPAHHAGNAKFVREAMCNLDWLVVADLYQTETSEFWMAPDLKDKAADIPTEVYFLPVASILEKPGTILNSGRTLQWRQQATKPAGDTKSDLEIMNLLHKKVVELYKNDAKAVCPEPILKTKWDYDGEDGEADWCKVAWELNGYTTADTDFSKDKVSLLPGFAKLAADGSTACAIWIYSGYFNDSEHAHDPSMQPISSRGKEDPSGLGVNGNWAFSWPANRRVIYNRACADINGKPWNDKKWFHKWNGKQWESYDVPDFVASKTDEKTGEVTWIEPNNKAFMMRWEQNACLFTNGLADMPIPEHYEPVESPTDNALNGAGASPLAKWVDDESVQLGDRSQYPIVATTYSITEHWQTGAQSHSCPALNEAQPKQFCEISEELAVEKGIKNGDKVRIFNNRSSVEVYAMVTHRLVPLEVNGETVHEIGIIHHWGWANTFTQGDVVNELVPNVGDPNSFIYEYKAFLVDIEKA